MNAIAHLILPYLLTYKYLALFSITLVAALILPIPPGTLIMGASAFAYQGLLSFPLVIASAALGNIVGDNIGYWLARKYGKKVLIKIGFKKTLESTKYQSIETKLKARPGFLIFISRFEVFTNLAVNLICGLSKVPYKKYLFYEVIGEVLQVSIYASIGYFFGENWELINALIGRFLVVIILVALLFVILKRKQIAHKLFKNHEI